MKKLFITLALLLGLSSCEKEVTSIEDLGKRQNALETTTLRYKDYVAVQVYPGYQHVFVLAYNPTQPPTFDQTCHSRVRVQGFFEGQFYEMPIEKAYKIVYTINEGVHKAPTYGNPPVSQVLDSVDVTPTTITQFRDDTPAVDYGRFRTIGIYDILNGTTDYDVDPSIDDQNLRYNTFYWTVNVKLYFNQLGYPPVIEGTLHQLSRFEGITSYITGTGILGGAPAGLASGPSPTYETIEYSIPYIN